MEHWICILTSAVRSELLLRSWVSNQMHHFCTGTLTSLSLLQWQLWCEAPHHKRWQHCSQCKTMFIRWCATPQLETEGLLIQLNVPPGHTVGSVTHIAKLIAVCNCKQDSHILILCMQVAIRNLELLQRWVQKLVIQTNQNCLMYRNSRHHEMLLKPHVSWCWI